MRLMRPGTWWRRPRTGRTPSFSDGELSHQQIEDLGLRLRGRREALGLSLRDLATQLRITTPVLEALERGWLDRLPERAYLASMLPQIEHRLELPAGCLDPLLPAPLVVPRSTAKTGLGRFTLGNIDVFTTWQGSLVYGVVIAISLLAINRQQQDLAQRNSLSLEPVRADLSAIATAEAADTTMPELRPLQRARQRRPQDWLELPNEPRSPSVGILQLELKKPHALELFSGGGDRLQMKIGAGQLTLQLTAPIELRLDPPAAAEDQLLWNGIALTPEPKKPGIYRVSSAEAPSLDRPQTAPLAP